MKREDCYCVGPTGDSLSFVHLHHSCSGSTCPTNFSHRVFQSLYENADIGFSSLLHENKKSIDKMLPPVGKEPRQPLILSSTLSFLR